MRQGNHNKQRMRGRNRKSTSSASRTIESNGPDVKVRGNAQHIAEKYIQLARDAQAGGDRIMAENYLQHAEHYNRIIASANSNQSYGQSRFQSTQSNNASGGETEQASEEPVVIGEDESDQVEAEVTRYSQDRINSDLAGEIIDDSSQSKLFEISDEPENSNEKKYKSQHRTTTPRVRGTRRAPVTKGRGSRTSRTSASS